MSERCELCGLEPATIDERDGDGEPIRLCAACHQSVWWDIIARRERAAREEVTDARQ